MSVSGRSRAEEQVQAAVNARRDRRLGDILDEALRVSRSAQTAGADLVALLEEAVVVQKEEVRNGKR